MEDVMVKVQDLYTTLQAKSSELRAKSEALDARIQALESSELGIAEEQRQLAKDKQAVKAIKDVLAEKQKNAELSAELKLATTELEKEKEKFDAYVKFKTNELVKLRQAVDDDAEDVRGTRARLMVEVKRVEEERANMKQSILNELAGKI